MSWKLLDLFCGAGGCSMGYHKAGFEVTGCDINPQPNYPFEFYKADALSFDLSGFDVIHASPPCQQYSVLAHLSRQSHKKLIDPVRELLKASKKHYIIENVPGAPLLKPTMLCGSMFCLSTLNGAQLRRHRIFETSFDLEPTPYCEHSKYTIGVFGNKARDTAAEKRHYSQSKETRGQPVGIKFTLYDAQVAMGIYWMNFKELSQAIPPAYTEWIGNQLIEVLEKEAEKQKLTRQSVPLKK